MWKLWIGCCLCSYKLQNLVPWMFCWILFHISLVVVLVYFSQQLAARFFSFRRLLFVGWTIFLPCWNIPDQIIKYLWRNWMVNQLKFRWKKHTRKLLTWIMQIRIYFVGSPAITTINKKILMIVFSVNYDNENRH